MDIEQGVKALHAVIDETFDSNEIDAEEAQRAEALLDDILCGSEDLDDAEDILAALRQAYELYCETVIKMNAAHFSTIDLASDGGDEHSTFILNPHEDGLTVSWPAQFGENLVAAVMNVTQALREADQEPGFTDFVVCLNYAIHQP